MYRKPKKNSEFEQEFTSIVPDRDEIRFVTKRNTQCSFLYESNYPSFLVSPFRGHPSPQPHTVGSGALLTILPLLLNPVTD